LALRLADRLPADIVSVDSAMVYRGMDIGTAKPSLAVRERYPHRLVDVVEPAEPYSAARFAVDARREIETIHGKQRIPLLVGGTFLYFRALEQGLTELPHADPELRAVLAREAQKLGWPALHQRLEGADPQAAAAIHPNDAQRIQRALEILALSGHGPSYWHARASSRVTPWAIYKFALAPEQRAVLHKRIEHRLESMMDQGFLDEVAALRRRPDVTQDLPAMRAVGYRQLWQYLDGRCNLSEAVHRSIVATRQLAKRQITWMRGQQPLARLTAADRLEVDNALRLLEKAGLQTG
jgi:tRNA dimethylallyltransferase